MGRFTNMFLKLKLEVKDLTGKHALITGGSEGIGYHTALHLAKMGCRVTIASRSEQKCKDAVQSLQKLSKNDQIDYDILDLGSFEQVKDFAQKFSNKYDSLDYAVLNAGTSFLTFGTTVDGIERTLHINHLGHMQLALLLLPIIKKSQDPRIIFLSSDLHLDTKLKLPRDLETSPDNSGITMYPKSKLMNVIVVKELAKKLKNTNIKVCSVHPGFVVTELAHKDTKGTWSGFFISKIIGLLHFLLARNGEQGAITSAFAVTNDNIISGEYYDSCKVAKHNPQADDVEFTSKFWDQSIKLIGINENEINYN